MFRFLALTFLILQTSAARDLSLRDVEESHPVLHNLEYSQGEVGEPAQPAEYSQGQVGEPAQPAEYSQGEVGEPAQPAEYSQGQVGEPAQPAEYSQGQVGEPAQPAEYSQGEVGVPAQPAEDEAYPEGGNYQEVRISDADQLDYGLESAEDVNLSSEQQLQRSEDAPEDEFEEVLPSEVSESFMERELSQELPQELHVAAEDEETLTRLVNDNDKLRSTLGLMKESIDLLIARLTEIEDDFRKS